MTYPSASNVPETEVVGDQVRISWEAPYSGGQGVPIIAYQILIKQKDGTFVEDSTNCDGVNDQDIIDDLECFIPMERLRDPNAFNLVQGDLVAAQVAVINQKGSG